VKAIDTNVLVYARREELPKHTRAVALLRELAQGQVPWGIPVFCIGEFLRVVTHRRVFNPPTPLEDALAAIDALLESPTVRLLMPGERYWTLLTDTASQAQTTGNLVFDAQIAAVCLEHGVESLVSEDRDFTRFQGLSVLPI
jgi:toxin-antitoxin system PIN domain toxin